MCKIVRSIYFVFCYKISESKIKSSKYWQYQTYVLDHLTNLTPKVILDNKLPLFFFL